MARIDILEYNGGKININCSNENILSIEGQTLYVNNGKEEIDNYIKENTKPQIDAYAQEVVKPYTDAAQIASEDICVQAIGADLVSENSSLRYIYDNIDNIKTAAEAKDSIVAVAGSVDEISAMNNNITSVNAVAENLENIKTAAEAKDSIVAVAGSVDEISAVNNNITSVNAVAGNLENIKTAAEAKDSIVAVAGSVDEISAVNNNITSVNAVAGNITDISAVSSVKEQIVNIGGSLEAVTQLGNNIGDVCAVADNLRSITSAAIWAEGEDTEVATFGGTHSAKGWAEIAGRSHIGAATETTAGIARIATMSEASAGLLDNVIITPKTLAQTQSTSRGEVISLESTSGTISLQSGNVYSMTMTGETTFILPQVTDTKDNQIKLYLTLSGSPKVNWGTDLFFNKEDVAMEEGSYKIVFDYHPPLAKWVVNIIPVRTSLKIVDSFRFTVNSGNDALFVLPTAHSYGNGQSYNWIVDWGDGTQTSETGVGDCNNGSGITHTYPQANTNYQIAVQTSEKASKWGQCFGFYNTTAGANSASNKAKMLSLDSPFSEIMFGDETGNIGQQCFCNMFCKCPSLTMGDAFNLPQNITKVGDSFCSGMFEGCTSLTMNKVFTLPQNMTSVGNLCFARMFYNCENLTINTVCSLSGGITTKGNEYCSGMFAGCVSLPDINVLGNSATIGEKMFERCTSLNEIVISDYITEIQAQAFNECSGLTTVTIGNLIESIADDAFLNCINIMTININRNDFDVLGTEPWGADNAEVIWLNSAVINPGDDW